MGKYSQTVPSKWSRHTPPPNQAWKICSSHCTKAKKPMLPSPILALLHFLDKRVLEGLSACTGCCCARCCRAQWGIIPLPFLISSLLVPPSSVPQTTPSLVSWDSHTHKVFLYGIGVLCSCRSLGCPCRAWKWKGRSGMSTLLEWSS